MLKREIISIAFAIAFVIIVAGIVVYWICSGALAMSELVKTLTAVFITVALGILAWAFMPTIKRWRRRPPVKGSLVLLGKYSSGDFMETRPILLEEPNMSGANEEKARDAYRKARSEYEKNLIERYKAEELIEWRGQRYPLSVLFSCNLQESQVEEKFDIKKYEPPEVIYQWGCEQLLDFQKGNPLIKRGRPLYDGFLYHFEKLAFLDDKLTIWFQESSFYKYVLTNLAMDVYSKHKMKTLRDVLEPGEKGRLKPIEQSLCANGLGIGCIVKSNDGKFVVVWRSDKVSNAKLTFAPSASGTMKLEESPPHGSMPSIFQAARIQLWQEMSVSHKHIKHISFLGITRELERGGQPDGHFYVEVDLSFDELVKLREKAEHREEHTHYIPIESRDIANYVSDPDSAPALRGCIYLLSLQGDR